MPSVKVQMTNRHFDRFRFSSLTRLYANSRRHASVAESRIYQTDHGFKQLTDISKYGLELQTESKTQICFMLDIGWSESMELGMKLKDAKLTCKQKQTWMRSYHKQCFVFIPQTKQNSEVYLMPFIVNKKQYEGKTNRSIKTCFTGHNRAIKCKDDCSETFNQSLPFYILSFIQCEIAHHTNR